MYWSHEDDCGCWRRLVFTLFFSFDERRQSGPELLLSMFSLFKCARSIMAFSCAPSHITTADQIMCLRRCALLRLALRPRNDPVPRSQRILPNLSRTAPATLPYSRPPLAQQLELRWSTPLGSSRYGERMKREALRKRRNWMPKLRILWV